MVERTTNFNLIKVALDKIPWHEDVNGNFSIIDALMARYIAVSDIQGIWINAQAVTVGQRWVDPDTETIYEVLVAHTTASTGTFATDRAANTANWQGVTIDQAFEGTWAAGTAYAVNDFVIDSNRYGVVAVAHTSVTSYDVGVAAGDIITLIDLSADLAAAEASATAAAASAASITLPIPVTSGGTGATTVSAAATALGLGTSDSPAFAGLELITVAGADGAHAAHIDVDAAGYGDIDALHIVFVTGAIQTGEDNAAIVINVDDTHPSATGGDVFGIKVLTTDGNADTVCVVMAGPVVAPIQHASGTFANPTTGTNNTAGPADVADMIDGSIGTNTTIFVADDDYILIGAAAPFTEIEFIIETPASNPGIKPTFGYSTAGAGTFTSFTPIDGTAGFTHTGVLSWDAADLTAHDVNTDTSTYDIKITRTHAAAGSVSLYYAKTAATVLYSWDKDGNVSIKTIELGHATDTTFTRVSAGLVAIEGSNILLASGLGSITQAYDAATLKSNATATLTAGFDTTPNNAGTKSTGTFTPDPAVGNFQYAVNGGAHTLDPPGKDCTMIIQYTNNGSAGTITTSGFTIVDGGTISTTDTDDFFFFITEVNGFSHLHVKALQ